MNKVCSVISSVNIYDFFVKLRQTRCGTNNEYKQLLLRQKALKSCKAYKFEVQATVAKLPEKLNRSVFSDNISID